MRLSSKHIAIANRLRIQVQRETDTIGDGEGVAMILLWTFMLDHARAMGMDVEQLARDQLEAFIVYARENVTLEREH